MPRPTFPRNVGFIPEVTYFKPAGLRLAGLEEVILGNDELEALRLKDLLGLSQEEAAKAMNISQPTFHRLIALAHEKMADAVINGKALRIEGGNVAFSDGWATACGRRRRCRHGWEGEDARPVAAGVSPKEEHMKIAITSTDGTLEGRVDERFGRARKLIIYEPETKKVEVVDNASQMGAAQGAGIQAAQNVANTGARAVISGHLGPNAFRVLQTAGISVYSAVNMSVAEAIEGFEQGKLTHLAGADVNGHW